MSIDEIYTPPENQKRRLRRGRQRYSKKPVHPNNYEIPASVFRDATVDVYMLTTPNDAANALNKILNLTTGDEKRGRLKRLGNTADTALAFLDDSLERRAPWLKIRLKAYAPPWHEALIVTGLAKRPDDPELLEKGVLLWTGARMYWIHGVWSEVGKESMKLPTFVATYLRQESGVPFSDKQVSSIRRHGEPLRKTDEDLVRRYSR